MRLGKAGGLKIVRVQAYTFDKIVILKPQDVTGIKIKREKNHFL